MAKRLIFPLFIGLGGLAILLSLGIWQMQRLQWKQGVLAEIEARIAAAPVALPAAPDPGTDRYLPVQVTGQFDAGGNLRVLASIKRVGPIYRLIYPFRTQAGRRVMVDAGWVGVEQAAGAMPDQTVSLTGNLDWPRETDSFTPAPDIAGNTWFARDVVAMAQVLQTEPVLIVLREAPQSGLPTSPLPVDTAGIPNDHLQYAITWFALAAVWVAMTTLYLLRTTRSADKG